MILQIIILMVWGAEFPYGAKGAEPPMLPYNPKARSRYTPEKIAGMPDLELNEERKRLLDEYRGLCPSGHKVNPIMDEVSVSFGHVNAELARRATIRRSREDAVPARPSSLNPKRPQ